MQRFAKVPVHTAALFKSAERAAILESIRDQTVGSASKGQHCKVSTRWWMWSVPWISLRQVQDHIKWLVENGYIIRTQLFTSGGQRGDSLFGITAKGLSVLSLESPHDLVNPEVVRMHDVEVDSYLTSKTALGGSLTSKTAQPNAGNLTRKTAHIIDVNKTDIMNRQTNTREHPAAPEPAAPEKVKTKSEGSTVREQELAQRLLDIWNSACDRAKLTRRSLPKCLKFPVDAMPAMKKYMKVYTDDEIIQLVTDGSRSVQKNDFYHERRYGFVNLMRNLGANANLSAPAERSADAPDGASPIPVAPSPKSAGLFDFDQDEAAAERQKLLDYEASLPLPEFPC